MLGWRVALFGTRAGLGSRGLAVGGHQLGMLCGWLLLLCVAIPSPRRCRLRGCCGGGGAPTRLQYVAILAAANRSFG